MIELPKLAISIRQPWAWAIFHLGKDVENRSWRHRFRGPVLIHAGKGLRQADLEDCAEMIDAHPELAARLKAAGGFDREALLGMTGGIVGAVTITDCVSASDSPWFAGPHAFTLANPHPLPFRACPGALGFFDPDREAAPETRCGPIEQLSMFDLL
jgi:hypothetical protein